MLHVTRREAQWGGASFVVGLLLALALFMPAEGRQADARTTAASAPDVVVRVTSMASHDLDVRVLLRDDAKDLDNASLSPSPGQRTEAAFQRGDGVYTVVVQWSFRAGDEWRRQSQQFMISTGNCAGPEVVEFVIDAEAEANRGRGYVDVADAWSHCGP